MDTDSAGNVQVSIVNGLAWKVIVENISETTKTTIVCAPAIDASLLPLNDTLYKEFLAEKVSEMRSDDISLNYHMSLIDDLCYRNLMCGFEARFIQRAKYKCFSDSVMSVYYRNGFAKYGIEYLDEKTFAERNKASMILANWMSDITREAFTASNLGLFGREFSISSVAYLPLALPSLQLHEGTTVFTDAIGQQLHVAFLVVLTPDICVKRKNVFVTCISKNVTAICAQIRLDNGDIIRLAYPEMDVLFNEPLVESLNLIAETLKVDDWPYVADKECNFAIVVPKIKRASSIVISEAVHTLQDASVRATAAIELIVESARLEITNISDFVYFNRPFAFSISRGGHLNIIAGVFNG